MYEEGRCFYVCLPTYHLCIGDHHMASNATRLANDLGDDKGQKSYDRGK
jgi:hypothetical protein